LKYDGSFLAFGFKTLTTLTPEHPAVTEGITGVTPPARHATASRHWHSL
jgi:hypothetical protein